MWEPGDESFCCLQNSLINIKHTFKIAPFYKAFYSLVLS